ncbi:MAG: hypothetical protein ACRDT4_24585 [Micromonosporaceae bacterium]
MIELVVSNARIHGIGAVDIGVTRARRHDRQRRGAAATTRRAGPGTYSPASFAPTSRLAPARCGLTSTWRLRLRNIEGVIRAAAALGGAIDVQVVAFPQLGVIRVPGAAELIREAVTAGASVIGGPDPCGYDGDLHGQLDTIFGLATDLDIGLDIHLHDRGHQGLAVSTRTGPGVATWVLAVVATPDLWKCCNDQESSNP